MQNMDVFPRMHSWKGVMIMGGLRGTPLVCTFFFFWVAKLISTRRPGRGSDVNLGKEPCRTPRTLREDIYTGNNSRKGGDVRRSVKREGKGRGISIQVSISIIHGSVGPGNYALYELW